MPDLTQLELADLPAVVVETLPTEEQLAGTHAWIDRVLCGDYRVSFAVYLDPSEVAPMKGELR